MNTYDLYRNVYPYYRGFKTVRKAIAERIQNLYVGKRNKDSLDTAIYKYNSYTKEFQLILTAKFIGYRGNDIYYLEPETQLNVLNGVTGVSKNIIEVYRHVYVEMRDYLIWISYLDCVAVYNCITGKVIKADGIYTDYNGYFLAFEDDNKLTLFKDDVVLSTTEFTGDAKSLLFHRISDDAVLIHRPGRICICDHKFNELWDIEDNVEEAHLIDKDRIIVKNMNRDIYMTARNGEYMYMSYCTNGSISINRTERIIVIVYDQSSAVYDFKFNKITQFGKDIAMRSCYDYIYRFAYRNRPFSVHKTDEFNAEYDAVIASRIEEAFELNKYLARLVVLYL